MSLLVLSSFICLVLYATSLQLSFKLQTTRLKHLSIEEQAQTERINQMLSEVKKLEKDRNRIMFIRSVLGKKTYWSEVFREFSHLIPEGLWLTGFTSVYVEGARRLVLKGEATSANKVAGFLLSVEQSPLFGKATLIFSEVAENVRPHLYRFQFEVPVAGKANGGSS